MITADQVEEAAELLKTTWAKGTYHAFNYAEDGSMSQTYCSIGALDRVINGDVCAYLQGQEREHPLGSIEDDAGLLFTEAGVLDHFDVITWNDDEETTHEEVLDGFLIVAKYLRNKGE